MDLQINDKSFVFEDELLIDLLKLQGISESSACAVAVNESVIPKEQWSSYLLQDKDSVLIIKPTQGG